MIRLLLGDCREVLKTLPDESVHCCVTSPPYWGLRDYGVDGQMGMEATLHDFVDGMVSVFREVKRVLRKDGTLWLNLGDSYAASVNGRSAADTKATGNDDRAFRDKSFSTIGPIRRGQSDNKGNAAADGIRRNVAESTLKPKDLCGIPWRVAFALQEDGWWLRQDIIWSKPNPMPESIRDRCTKAHEYMFLLSKSAKYYFDAEAIFEPFADARMGNPGAYKWKQGAGGVAGGGPNSLHKGDGTVDGWNVDGKALGRNRRSVWTVTTQSFSEAHFATFPPDLIEPCIKAGCPKDGLVLDPFGGAGTTGLVADRLGRNAVLIELNY